MIKGSAFGLSLSEALMLKKADNSAFENTTDYRNIAERILESAVHPVVSKVEQAVANFFRSLGGGIAENANVSAGEPRILSYDQKEINYGVPVTASGFDTLSSSQVEQIANYIKSLSNESISVAMSQGIDDDSFYLSIQANPASQTSLDSAALSEDAKVEEK